MESYLVDKAVLGEFVDNLISAKYPDQPADKYANLREDAIKALDHQILRAIIGKLTKEQGAELNKLLDDPNATEATFTEFFEQRHINLEETIKDAMVNFRDNFLKGGQNV